ncbi:unnamed protein product, partial [Menidia menidia]
MEQIILLCVLSTCLSAVQAQKFLLTPKWIPSGFKELEGHNEGAAMDKIIKVNELRGSQIIDGTTTLREGDIAVSSGRRSKVCFARSCLWSKSVDGHVYIAYTLSSQYSDIDTKLIKNGMDNIEDGTCVRFVPRTHQRDFIDIQPKSGCWSYLGSRGGKQTLSLQNPDCMQEGVITHEFMHALGFVHEQSRFDRDNYITVMWPNIWRDRLRNFEKFRTDNLDLPYDYSSIMHFGMYAYSMAGEPTLIPKNSRKIKLGQASSLSHIDKLKINRLYQCGWYQTSSTHFQKIQLEYMRAKQDEISDRDEMTTMDQILDVNKRLRAPRGLSIREGDIAYSYVRSAINCPGNACMWPKSIDGFVYVPFILSPLYDDMDRITIETGMQDISAGTCIKFVPRTHEANFLDIQPRYGCWSFLGQTGGSQTLSLQTPGCMWSGIAAHEFMHALGFVHEQSRSDRDHYVSIVWKNIMPDHIHNFRKQVTNNLNSPYDYNSIMHYGRYAFSEDGGPTIIPKPDPYIPIGQRDGPSALDLHKINVLYDC